MYKTFELYTNTFTCNTNKFTNINVIKKHMCTDTKLSKMPSSKLGLN